MCPGRLAVTRHVVERAQIVRHVDTIDLLEGLLQPGYAQAGDVHAAAVHLSLQALQRSNSGLAAVGEIGKRSVCARQQQDGFGVRPFRLCRQLQEQVTRHFHHLVGVGHAAQPRRLQQYRGDARLQDDGVCVATVLQLARELVGGIDIALDTVRDRDKGGGDIGVGPCVQCGPGKADGLVVGAQRQGGEAQFQRLCQHRGIVLRRLDQARQCRVRLVSFQEQLAGSVDSVHQGGYRALRIVQHALELASYLPALLRDHPAVDDVVDVPDVVHGTVEAQFRAPDADQRLHLEIGKFGQFGFCRFEK